ncbi:MAG: hypothetical protein ACKVOM_09145 [Ferruginibacter sp.]
MLKPIIFFMIVIGISIVIPFRLMAQPTLDPCTAPEDYCPIDNNLVVLMVAAAGIAAKKGYDHKKKMRTITLS